MKTPCVFNVQKFSLHDGPGIRTTIFFKGCPLRCLWCHNPESQSYEPEAMHGSKEEQVGKQYAPEELVQLAAADQMFYDQSGGGVTFSGGEVMTQDMDYIEVVAKGLRSAGISLAVDTSGYAPPENFLRLLPYVDLFLFDLKLLDERRHKEYTGVSNALILDTIKLLSERRAAIDLRLMLVGGVNDDPASVEAIGTWLLENKIALRQVSLLPYHDFGRDKYEKLGRVCTQNFEKPDDRSVQAAKDYLERIGYPVKIGG
jgi:pyruvate formate lyase activating enzyme